MYALWVSLSGFVSVNLNLDFSRQFSFSFARQIKVVSSGTLLSYKGLGGSIFLLNIMFPSETTFFESSVNSTLSDPVKSASKFIILRLLEITLK